MSKWDQLPPDNLINQTIQALKANGIESMVTENREEAKKKLFELLLEGSEVMNMTSVTLDTIGATVEITDSNRYKAIKKDLANMEPKRKREIGSAPDYAIGSVHAVTTDGQVLIASKTGSQLPAYAYGAEKVIWVVGAQKIVANTEEGLKRIYEYCLPLENERAKKAYGVTSEVAKILIINKEINPSRLTLIFVKENLGF